MLKKGHEFDTLVFNELDLVRKTYLNVPNGIKRFWSRKNRRPKLIHIYGWEDFLKALEKSIDSNPLMRIILDTIGEPDLRYFPIYSRNNQWYRRRSSKTTWDIWTYYDRVNRVRDYENNKIDFFLDKVVGWYPPILSWLYTERPTTNDKWDLLIYFIRKRYANKKISSTETVNWGTETESTWGSKEIYTDTNSGTSIPDVSEPAESNL